MPEREFSEEDKEGFRAAFTIFDKGCIYILHIDLCYYLIIVIN